ncbi:MAG: STAS/SEC14 domain-containing protein [Bacteroidales bacterium]|nr:STAS/SEC14 domain-containing protein [Bacteroidales bacterium]
MITYKFNKEEGILETTFSGDVSIKDISEYILTLSKDKTLPGKLKILTDVTKGKFSEGVIPKDMTILVEANKKSLAQRDFTYDAFVVSGSFEMALGMLYQKLNKIKNYKVGIFSTKEAALKWLQDECF